MQVTVLGRDPFVGSQNLTARDDLTGTNFRRHEESPRLKNRTGPASKGIENIALGKVVRLGQKIRDFSHVRTFLIYFKLWLIRPAAINILAENVSMRWRRCNSPKSEPEWLRCCTSACPGTASGS